jgi:hypothetical protein
MAVMMIVVFVMMVVMMRHDRFLLYRKIHRKIYALVDDVNRFFAMQRLRYTAVSDQHGGENNDDGMTKPGVDTAPRARAGSRR